MQKVINFSPHQGQQEILDKLHRYTVLVCGRRWGKTYIAAYLAFITLLLPNKVIWIVAPTYSLTEKVWKVVRKWAILHGQSWCTVTDSRLKIVTIWGTELVCKTAENPDSLIGEGVDFLIIDEAARIKDTVWDTELSPTLLDKKGMAFIITTPRGRNWVYNLYRLGKSDDPENNEYISFNFPSVTNPFIDPAEIEKERKKKPQAIFEQEYLAQFIDDAGVVFRNVDGCAIGQMQEPKQDEEYVMGVDLARKEDYTVIIVMRKDTQEVVYHDRFNEISWRVQKPRIIQTAKRYNNALIVMDTTGIGDVVFDDIQEADLNLQRYDFTNKSKTVLIENLIIALDERRMIYPHIPELLDELKGYEFEVNEKTRRISYNAPAGHHDDEVIALALANHGLNIVSSTFSFL